jgi:hypothetical protein
MDETYLVFSAVGQEKEGGGIERSRGCCSNKRCRDTILTAGIPQAALAGHLTGVWNQMNIYRFLLKNDKLLSYLIERDKYR